MAIKRKRGNRGTTLLEVLTASALSVFVIGTSVTVLISGSASWAKGQTRIAMEMGSQQAMRKISLDLRETIDASVDANGLGINYKLPRRDGSGNLIIPMEWDEVERRIEFHETGTNMGIIRAKVGGNYRTLLEDVPKLNPQTLVANKFFVPGKGTIVRSVDVVLVGKAAESSHAGTDRLKETIYLRNIPSLSR